MATGMKELKLWQEAVALAADVVRLARSAAKRETKVLTDRLIAAAADVPSRIAIGYAHPAARDQLGLYLHARDALAEVETLLAVGRHATLLSADAALAASARAGGVQRLLAGYVAYLERQIAEADRTLAPVIAHATSAGAARVAAAERLPPPLPPVHVPLSEAGN